MIGSVNHIIMPNEQFYTAVSLLREFHAWRKGYFSEFYSTFLRATDLSISFFIDFSTIVF